MNGNKEYQLNYLSDQFYEKYKHVDYPEIENKENRPYMVLLVKIDENIFAIPFRTNVSHNHCYRFKTSSRPTNSVTGLDYTKAVIVNEISYIGGPARINDKEYIELSNNYGFIIKQFRKYVMDYISYVKGNKTYYASQKFKFTTLKYFHLELGLSSPSST